MFRNSRYQLIGLPVMHAAGLTLWSLLQPENGLGAIYWWALWLPAMRVIYDTRATLIGLAGAAPFLIFAAYQWIA
ncbi:MAG: hypothetical protein H7067_20030 [Burkholderiales bacterium]|nr:hypothetical protein [Opitutaceae bacterium]